jgi:hypothetical protein
LDHSAGIDWSRACRFIVLPFYAVVFTTAFLPAVWAIRRTVARRQARQGCCARCGYDLRATPDRCPECGTVPDTD